MVTYTTYIINHCTMPQNKTLIKKDITNSDKYYCLNFIFKLKFNTQSSHTSSENNNLKYSSLLI